MTLMTWFIPPSGGALAQPYSDFIPVTDAMLQEPAPGDWLMWRRTLDSWGFSPLEQIDRSNVGELQLVWSRGLTAGSQQGTPLIYDGVLYMPNPNDVIQAIDAVTGDLRWEYRRPIPDDVGERPLPVVQHGPIDESAILRASEFLTGIQWLGLDDASIIYDRSICHA